MLLPESTSSFIFSFENSESTEVLGRYWNELNNGLDKEEGNIWFCSHPFPQSVCLRYENVTVTHLLVRQNFFLVLTKK